MCICVSNQCFSVFINPDIKIRFSVHFKCFALGARIGGDEPQKGASEGCRSDGGECMAFNRKLIVVKKTTMVVDRKIMVFRISW